MTELDKEKLKKELTEIYEEFDKGNYSKEIVNRANKIDMLYSGAIKLLDDTLGDAIYLLSFVIQKEFPGGGNKQEEVKKILKRLKEEPENRRLVKIIDPKLKDINNYAKTKLIELYTGYIENPSDEFIQNAASEIGGEFSNAADAIFDKVILNAIHKIDSMAFGEVSVEEAKKILKELKEYN